LKASELTAPGYYWYTPGEDSPDQVRQHWTAEFGPTLVSVSINPQSFGETPLAVKYSYLRGPGHSQYDALQCGGEFIGPARPQDAEVRATLEAFADLTSDLENDSVAEDWPELLAVALRARKALGR
jgi:hypothetical protein